VARLRDIKNAEFQADLESFKTRGKALLKGTDRNEILEFTREYDAWATQKEEEFDVDIDVVHFDHLLLRAVRLEAREIGAEVIAASAGGSRADKERAVRMAHDFFVRENNRELGEVAMDTLRDLEEETGIDRPVKETGRKTDEELGITPEMRVAAQQALSGGGTVHVAAHTREGHPVRAHDRSPPN
jgi:hypothetical protein